MERAKNIKTNKGNIRSPFFMPDATRGLVKFLSSGEVRNSGSEAVVVNTYHLHLQPGAEMIEKAGGIHAFMDWDGLILSDSGGFQVFSLIYNNPDSGKIEKDRVVFRSPIDGAKLEFTPELSIQIQFQLGVDMMVCLDDCPPNNISSEDMKDSVKRTVEWAKRCKKEHEKQIAIRKIPKEKRPLLFSVIQGGEDIKLRHWCAEELKKVGFDGYGFGAMPVDSRGRFNDKLLRSTAEMIPEDNLKFALGVGNPEDIVKCVGWGWDMFDCVIPTREGRHGKLLYRRPGTSLNSKDFYSAINIGNTRFKEDNSPVNENSRIKELTRYSKAYLRHLFKVDDPLGRRLASLNNLEFYNRLISELRE